MRMRTGWICRESRRAEQIFPAVLGRGPIDPDYTCCILMA
jgi:hypothetical protein